MCSLHALALMHQDALKKYLLIHLIIYLTIIISQLQKLDHQLGQNGSKITFQMCIPLT